MISVKFKKSSMFALPVRAHCCFRLFPPSLLPSTTHLAMSALHGDGIKVNFAFFHLLWSKGSDSQALRVPDTVVFLSGLPHQWYFTTRNGGPNRDQTMVQRKRKTNITLENIEEVFLDKAASSRGTVGEDVVVAYFIERGETESARIEYFNPRSLRKKLFDSTPFSFVISVAHTIHTGLRTCTNNNPPLSQMISYKVTARQTRVAFFSDS